jgi:hypothetical protein
MSTGMSHFFIAQITASFRTSVEATDSSGAAVAGRPRLCHHAALQFHHVDPSTKAFTVRDGDTRSLARMRDEASKCVLLCANCHAEVEAGLARLPLAADRAATEDDPG